MFVLDPNIIIYHLRGEHEVREMLDLWLSSGERLFISAITRIELFAAPVFRPGEEEAINALLSSFVLVPVDAQIADIAARIKRTYKLPLGDSIIAATALLTSAALITRNIRDFRKIKEIKMQEL